MMAASSERSGGRPRRPVEQPPTTPPAAKHAQGSIEPAVQSTAERDALRQTVDEQHDALDRLALRVGFLTGRQRELRALLMDAHDQLQQRDDELVRLRERIGQLEARGADLKRSHHRVEALLAERDAELARSHELVTELRGAVKSERERLRAFKATRYWQFRMWVKRLIGRS